MDNRVTRFDSWLGVAVVGVLVTGFGGLLVALFGMFSENWTAAAIALLASAFAFGLAINGILRR